MVCGAWNFINGIYPLRDGEIVRILRDTFLSLGIWELLISVCFGVAISMCYWTKYNRGKSENSGLCVENFVWWQLRTLWCSGLSIQCQRNNTTHLCLFGLFYWNPKLNAWSAWIAIVTTERVPNPRPALFTTLHFGLKNSHKTTNVKVTNAVIITLHEEIILVLHHKKKLKKFVT